MKKKRITYLILFCVLLLIEILIALFVRDDFVRPYVGDMLVTVLLCCLIRVLFPNGIKLLPLYIFLFAAAVEVGQYFRVVELLGLSNNRFVSTLVGTTFSVHDLVCYAIGSAAFWGTDALMYKLVREE